MDINLASKQLTIDIPITQLLANWPSLC